MTLDKALSQFLQNIGEHIQEEAKDTNLFHHGANFESQITTTQIAPDEQEVTSGAKWSSYLEFGNPSEGFIITPKNGPYLVFYSYRDHHWVKTKQVRAHGPLPFMEQSAEKVLQDEALLKTLLDQAIKDNS